jgi:microsomal dipeptidase-like Zn-dependent dipeptidase
MHDAWPVYLLVGLLVPVTSCGNASGWADLHAHPASHLAFGYDGAGHQGLFWGTPGVAFSSSAATVSADLAACDANTHSNFDVNPVGTGTRQQELSAITQTTFHNHLTNGAPTCRGWPHALDVNHQQMHIAAIHRAWQGGLRVMMADVTDNETLDMVWLRGTSLTQGQFPAPQPGFAAASARTQLDWLHAMAAANGDWMTIVKTPEEARAAIAANRLAMVLGVEMDTLSPTEILALARDNDVRHVIPIHLADNPNIGASAAYGDIFNSSGDWLTGSFQTAEADPLLLFHFAVTQQLVRGPLNAIAPAPLRWQQACDLGYAPCPGRTGGIPLEVGLRNKKGLVENNGIQSLMAAGLLVDVAHMSFHSTEDTLALAERFHYPVLDSHTGLRADGAPGWSERDLLESHARRIAALGGVVGLGTGGNVPSRVLYDGADSPLISFADDGAAFTAALRSSATDDDPGDQMVSRLIVSMESNGYNGPAQGILASASVPRVSGQALVLPFGGAGLFQVGTSNVETLTLPTVVRLGDINGFGIKTNLTDPNAGWQLVSVRVDYVTDAGDKGTLMQHGRHTYGSYPQNILINGANPSWQEIFRGTYTGHVVGELDLTLLFGTRGVPGQDENLFGHVALADGRSFHQQLNPSDVAWAGGSTQTVRLPLPTGIPLADITAVSVSAYDRPQATGSDGTDIVRFALEQIAADGVHDELASRNGQPYSPLGAGFSELPLYVRSRDSQPVATTLGSANPPVGFVRVTVRPADNIEAGHELHAVLRSASGTLADVEMTQGGQWFNGSSYAVLVKMPSNTKLSDLRWFDLKPDRWFSHGVAIGEVKVEALGDPVGDWNSAYGRLSAIVPSAGFGTDMNGLAPQVPFSLSPVTFPLTVASSRMNGVTAISGNSTLGSCSFKIENDGLAHYGMLPDFLGALESQPGGKATVDSLFGSADATITMWEHAATAAHSVSTPSGGPG